MLTVRFFFFLFLRCMLFVTFGKQTAPLVMNWSPAFWTARNDRFNLISCACFLLRCAKHSGVFEPRISPTTLKSPRVVSTSFIKPVSTTAADFTLMLMTWGQFITHDLTKASSFTSGSFINSFLYLPSAAKLRSFMLNTKCFVNIQPTERLLNAATLPVANHWIQISFTRFVSQLTFRRTIDFTVSTARLACSSSELKLEPIMLAHLDTLNR